MALLAGLIALLTGVLGIVPIVGPLLLGILAPVLNLLAGLLPL